MPTSDAIVVLTTLASESEASTLVKTLVERRLIACGTILPGARSIYRWEGSVTDAQEVVAILKTRASMFGALEQAFSELHPYALPELIALPITAGLPGYLEWIAAETAAAPA